MASNELIRLASRRAGWRGVLGPEPPRIASRTRWNPAARPI